MLYRIGMLLMLVSTLLACRGSKKSEQIQEGPPTAQLAESAAPTDPCAGKPVRRTLDTVDCSEGGSKEGTTDLVDAKGAKLADLPNGTAIKRLREEPGSEDIKREPGHVDTAVCIAEGPHAGTVGYVQNTHIFAKCY